MDRRKEELAKKRAKLIELRKVREDRQKALATQQETVRAALIH